MARPSRKLRSAARRKGLPSSLPGRIPDLGRWSWRAAALGLVILAALGLGYLLGRGDDKGAARERPPSPVATHKPPKAIQPEEGAPKLQPDGKDELIRRMRAEFEKTMAEVSAAVNDAPDGHLIDASEERARDALGEFRRRAYETAVQMRVEATEESVAFSPSEPGSPRGCGSDGADVQRAGGASPSSRRKARRGHRRPGG